MCSCITKKLFKIILNLYTGTCIQHTSTQPNIKKQITSKFQEKILCARRASILSQFGFIPVSS